MLNQDADRSPRQIKRAVLNALLALTGGSLAHDDVTLLVAEMDSRTGVIRRQMMITHAILFIGAVYISAGVIFAMYFVAFGCRRIDPVARGASIGVRVLLMPGAAALWPILLLKCVRGTVDPACD